MPARRDRLSWMVRWLKSRSIFILLCVATWSAQGADPSRRTSPPYTGDLDIFEGKGRAKNLQIDRVMDLLGVKPGAHVADIGAGSGWFTVRAARRVGKDGLVYAVEINPDYLRHIEKRAKKAKLQNIRGVLGQPADPLLESGSVDVVLLLKTYHELPDPIALLRRLREALRPGGKLGIIDKNGKGDDHGVDAEIVIKEAAEAGFKLSAQHDFVKPDKVDYFLVFEADPAR